MTIQLTSQQTAAIAAGLRRPQRPAQWTAEDSAIICRLTCRHPKASDNERALGDYGRLWLDADRRAHRAMLAREVDRAGR